MSGGDKVLKLMEQAPLPKMVQSMAHAVAEAQDDLNMKALECLIRMSDPANGVALPGETEKRSLLELGFVPSFLHISEATLIARVAFSCAESEEYSIGGSVTAGYSVFSATINANYANKYSFETQGSSEIRTKLVSVPAPSELAQRLQRAAAKKGAA